jgi:transcriptional regulator with XRE-family HTH domain
MQRENTACLGNVIKSARRSMKMTQLQLADRLQITARYLKAIENNGKNPSYDLFVRILHELKISADMIFYHDHEDEMPAPRILPFRRAV